jgi:hypothetical protein
MRNALGKARPGVTLSLALAAASIAFGGVRGFAASFSVGSGALGAGSSVVASCGSGIALAYTSAFDPGIRGYAVNGIEVSNIPAGCLGKRLSVTFYGSDSEPSGSPVNSTLPASGTTDAISIAAGVDKIDASRISGISVVVS